jgi:hypothetical protein
VNEEKGLSPPQYKITDMETKFERTECFIGVFDILGFSNLVRTSRLEEVATLYLKVKKHFGDMICDVNLLCNRDIVKFYNFSDTFLIHTQNRDDINFQALLVACDALFLGVNEAAQNNNIAIRGAINSGEIVLVEGALIGNPIIEAFEKEKQQEWIGCWIGDDCLNKNRLNEYIYDKSIVEYVIPLKNGIVKKCYAFNWVKSVAHKYKIENKDYDFGPKEIIGSINFFKFEPKKLDVKRKYANTIIFVETVTTPEFVEEYRTRKYESRN